MTPEAVLTRARSAVGHGIAYGLGHGGLHPEDTLPTRDGQCDCSGFVSWVVGRSRNPAHNADKWPWWLSTDSVFADATGPQKLFRRVAVPTPGCFAVYGDYKGADGKVHQGHVGIVADPGAHTVVDCSVSGKGISEHAQPVFWSGSRPVVFCVYVGA